MNSVPEVPPPVRPPVADEMLAALDSVTLSGQRYLMHKIVGYLRGRLDEAARSVMSPINQHMCADHLERLVLEAGRPAPNIERFREKAKSLCELAGIHV